MIAVAVDGPAGAGKSTLAREIAKQLGMLYVDTGALYRAIGLYVLRCGVDPKDRTAVSPLLDNISVTMTHEQGNQFVWLCGEDVSGLIRTQEVSMAASQVSAHPEVRAFLFDLQRDLALSTPAVMDGRDIGTVVLPEAAVKIFLTASAEERARRRVEQLEKAGQPADFDRVLAEVKQRDEQDTNRPVAPLKQAEDAVLVDTTGETPEESLNRMIGIIREKIGSYLA